LKKIKKYSSLKENQTYDDLIKQYNSEFIIFTIIYNSNNRYDFEEFKKYFDDLQIMPLNDKIYVLNVCFEIYEKNYKTEYNYFEKYNKNILKIIDKNINNVKNKLNEKNMDISKINNINDIFITTYQETYNFLKNFAENTYVVENFNELTNQICNELDKIII